MFNTLSTVIKTRTYLLSEAKFIRLVKGSKATGILSKFLNLKKTLYLVGESPDKKISGIK